MSATTTIRSFATMGELARAVDQAGGKLAGTDRAQLPRDVRDGGAAVLGTSTYIVDTSGPAGWSAERLSAVDPAAVGTAATRTKNLGWLALAAAAALFAWNLAR